MDDSEVTDMNDDVEIDSLDAFIYESDEQWAVAYRVNPNDTTSAHTQFAWSSVLCATEANAESHVEQIRAAITHLEWVRSVDTKVVRLYPAPF